MLISTKEKISLGAFVILLSASVLLYFLDINLEAFVIFMLSLLALFLDSNQNTTFGPFTAKSIGNDELQWLYHNEPVFIVVNSYGWPVLDQLDQHKMQLISP